MDDEPFKCDCGYRFPQILVTFDSPAQNVMVTVVCPDCLTTWDNTSRSKIMS